MTTREPYRGPRIGLLRQRVTLQREGEIGRDPFNDPIYGVVEISNVPARIEPVKGDERIIAGGITATFTHHIHIRHRDDLDPTWKVRHGSTLYNVTRVANLDERRRFLTLECNGTSL